MDEAKINSGKNKLFGSFVIKYPKNNFFKKNGHRKSLDKNPSISQKEKKLLNDYSLMLKNNDSNKLYDSDNEDSSMIDENFIPEYTSNFSLNLKNLSFHKIKKKKDLKYVEILKQEAENKINAYQEQLKILCKSPKSSQEESEERESNESSSSSLKINSNILLNTDSSNTSNSNSLNENKKEQTLINTYKKETNKTNLSRVINKTEKNSSNNNISLAKDTSSKTLQKKK